MDSKRFLAMLAVSLGAALVVLGAFLKWWIPEEAMGWPPLFAGLALIGGGAILLRPAAQSPQ